MADGSVIIDTKMNNDALERGFERLKEDAESLGIACEKAGDKVKLAFADYDVTPKIQNAIAEVERAQNRLATATLNYKEAIAADDDSGAERAAAKMETAYNRVEDAQRRLSQAIAEAAQKQGASADEMVAKLNPVKTVLNAISSAVKKIASGFASLAKGALNGAASAVKGIWSGLKGAASAIGRMITGGKSLKQSFSGMLSSVRNMSLAMLSVRGVIGILRKAVSAYLSENEALSQQLSSAWTNLGNVLGPIIEKVINLVSTAISYITQFFSLLGIASSSASKEITAAGGAAKKETDKLKKTMMSFDELNTLKSDKEESSGGGGGSSSATATEITAELPDFAKLMAEQIKNGAWEDAAITLTSALNGMVSGVDWSDIGNKIGTGLDGALTFLSTAITTFDWTNLGASLATSANGIVESVDWTNLGTVLSGKFQIALETLAGFLNNLDMKELAKAASKIAIGFYDGISKTIEDIDWKKLGNQITTFISNIDYGGIFSAMAEGIGAAFGGLAALLLGLIEDPWKSVVDWWQENAVEDGEFTIEGLLQGIGNGLANIATWINENIFLPIWEGFKNAFGIHSPSTVMAELGGYISEGLLQGMSEKWSGVIDWLNEAVNGVKDTFSSAWEWISSVTTGIWDGITSFFSDVFAGNWASAWDTIAGTVSSVWDTIIGTITGAINDIITAINGLISGAASGINSVVDVLNGFSFTIPSWVPKLGGSTFGLNLGYVSAPQIPLLAQGAVLPANQPFLAVVGDQKHGTNVEAPLSTIQEAVAITMEDMMGGFMAGFEALLAENQRLRAVVENIEIGDTTIGKAAARYNSQVNVIRGNVI